MQDSRLEGLNEYKFELVTFNKRLKNVRIFVPFTAMLQLCARQ